jgi:hypothetical protein
MSVKTIAKKEILPHSLGSPLLAKPLFKSAAKTGCGLLDDFVQQEERGSRKVDSVKQSKNILLLEDGLKHVLSQNNAIYHKNDSGFSFAGPSDFEEWSSDFFKASKFDAKQITPLDIETLCLRFPNFEDHKYFHERAGVYLSWLVNHSNGAKFTLNLHGINDQMQHVCWGNKKIVTVFGNVDSFFCANMVSGKVVLHGNCTDSAAIWLSRGSVTIIGNASDHAGYHMRSGKLTIEGDAGRWVADEGKAGIVRVNGTAESFGKPATEEKLKNFRRRKINSTISVYNGDKVIVENGKCNDDPNAGITWG